MGKALRALEDGELAALADGGEAAEDAVIGGGGTCPVTAFLFGEIVEYESTAAEQSCRVRCEFSLLSSAVIYASLYQLPEILVLAIRKTIDALRP